MLTPCLPQMHTLTKMVVKDSKTAVANLTRDRKLTADAAADISNVLEDATEDSIEISEAIGIKTSADDREELEAELDKMLASEAADVPLAPMVPAVLEAVPPDPVLGLPDPPTTDPTPRNRRALVTTWLSAN